jgi:hypothetical protein
MLAGGVMGKLLVEDMNMSDITSHGFVCLDRAKMDSLVKQTGVVDGSASMLLEHMLRERPMDRPTAKQVEQALLQTRSAPALAVAALGNTASPFVVQGIPVQSTPAPASEADSPPGMEPRVSQQRVLSLMRKVRCMLDVLRVETSIDWGLKYIDDRDCEVIAHLALPASSQSPYMGALDELISLKCAPTFPPPQVKMLKMLALLSTRGHGRP